MKYPIIIEKTEDGTFGGCAPDIPGVGVTGDTPDEVRQLLAEGISFHLDGLTEDGIPHPQPTVVID